MKKVVDLENRWKAYKYKTAIFYTFIVVLVAFIALLIFFIKVQVYDKSKANAIALQQQKVKSAPVESTPKAESASSADSTQSTKMHNKINFICRQVTTDKLTVRRSASFQSKALGYYPLDAIFCVSESENGLVKTPNGWVSQSDKFSQVVDTNMFVDTGFYAYKNIAPQRASQSPKTNIEEVKVFDTPMNNVASSTSKAEQKPKPKPVIVSQNITKEQAIEIKKADFRRSKDYNTAIEVARFYFNNKDYDNSIRWALNASNVDSRGKQKSESWIIYAKSLYLSGKQEQAITVLNRYISSTNSQDAIDVLNNMKKGII